jgi:5-methylcytosine-specific restriction endonuclease McrA
MALKKKEREAIFNKYGGKCAYCGCNLEKGWHTDHIQPCRRIVKRTRRAYYNKTTGAVATRKDRQSPTFKEDFEWRDARDIVVGYRHPERNTLDNYMPSCPSCNINKHGDTIEKFRESIAGYLRSLNLRMVQYKVVKRYGLVEETGKPVVFYFETVESEKRTVL